MSASELILSVIKSTMPSIQFVARLADSDVIGVEQEYILNPTKHWGTKNTVEVDYDLVSEQGRGPTYISAPDAAEKYELSRSKVYNLCKSGDIIAFRDGKGKVAPWWIQEASLREYVERQKEKEKKNKKTPKKKGKGKKKKFWLF